MLTDPASPLTAGGTVALTLRFKDAGTVTFKVPVTSLLSDALTSPTSIRADLHLGHGQHARNVSTDMNIRKTLATCGLADCSPPVGTALALRRLVLPDLSSAGSNSASSWTRRRARCSTASS
jgi:hypothetical protein